MGGEVKAVQKVLKILKKELSLEECARFLALIAPKTGVLQRRQGASATK